MLAVSILVCLACIVAPTVASDLVALADLAESAPPELAADALIKIADLTPDLKPKRAHLERAFQLAGAAKYSVNQVGAVPLAFDTDSDSGLIQASLTTGLDRLSLQSRVVKAMLAIDKKRARDLLLEIPVLQIAPLTCKDAMRSAPDGLYETVGAVIESGFTPKELAEGKPLQLAEDSLRGIGSPVQLLPSLKMIENAKLPTAGLNALITLWASAAARMSADDHTFTSTTAADTNAPLTAEVTNAADLCRSRGISDAALIAAFNAYLERHRNSSRCEETTAQVVLWWTKPADKPILQALKDLRRQSKELTAPEWEAKAREFLGQLDRWHGDHDDSQASAFFQTSFAYYGLIDISPPGKFADSVIESYVSFLSRSPAEVTNPPEWAMMVNRLIHQRQSSRADKRSIQRVIGERGDAVMTLLLRLDELTPAP